MKTKTTIIVLAVMALASLLAVRATREANENRAAIDALAAERTGLRATTASLEQRLRTASEALAQSEQKTGQPPGEPGAGADANAAASGNDIIAKPATPARRLSATTIIANDPPKLAEHLQNYRASLDLFYGGMFKALGFSVEQVEKWKDVAVWDTQRWMDLSAAVEMQGLDRTSDAYKKLAAEFTKSRVAKERELLGDLEPRYREYNKLEPVRELAKRLASWVIYWGEPVSLAQVERTTQILAAHSQRNQTGSLRGWVAPDTINWEAARAQLQDVLLPKQIETLGFIVRQRATEVKADALTKRLTAEFKAKQASK